MERIFFGRVSSVHLAAFCRQFATYSDAGVDLIRSLESLRTQFQNTALGPILGRIIPQIRAGESLSDAMAEEPEAFDRLFLSMVRVAEARGGIPETMRMLADQYDSRVRLIRQARSAMIYPVIVIVVMLAVMFLMTTMLLPMLADLLKDLARGSGGEADLPMPSRVLIGFSSFVQGAGWWLAPLLNVVFIIVVLNAYKSRAGKAAMDELGLMTPVLGKMLRLFEVSRFSRTLSVLLNAGVDMKSALTLTADVMRLEPYRRAVEGTREEVIAGEELSEALSYSGRFATDVIALVNSGEETGRIPECLDKVADDYEERAGMMVKNLGQLIQPLILLVLAALALFIILAVILPYIKVITSLAGGG